VETLPELPCGLKILKLINYSFTYPLQKPASTDILDFPLHCAAVRAA